MSTGNGGKAKASKANGVRAAAVRFERGRLVVALTDAREVSVPLMWYPTLQRASPVARSRLQIIGGGTGIHWPRLDLDLSVAGLVNGLREAIPRPPDLIGVTRTTRRKSA